VRAGSVEITTIGGPTTLVRYGGLSLLIDRAFDPPRDYDTGRGYSLVKLVGPALTTDQLGPIDLVLLSHDQHWDNFDAAGREFAASVPAVLTTPAGAERIGANARGMATWSSLSFDRPDGATITVTSTPALHGPPGSASVMGDVTGFVLASEGQPTVYVSGDPRWRLSSSSEFTTTAGPTSPKVRPTWRPRSPPLVCAIVSSSSRTARSSGCSRTSQVASSSADSSAAARCRDSPPSYDV
jgi:L-ascorbate metabolism protein UlaG (beta-lactamase superfamily)